MNKKIGIIFVLLVGAMFLSACEQGAVGRELSRNFAVDDVQVGDVGSSGQVQGDFGDENCPPSHSIRYYDCGSGEGSSSDMGIARSKARMDALTACIRSVCGESENGEISGTAEDISYTDTVTRGGNGMYDVATVASVGSIICGEGVAGRTQ